MELTKQEVDFIVDMALNSLWNECEKKLKELHLGDIEKKNITSTRDEAKRLMKKLDPTLF